MRHLIWILLLATSCRGDSAPARDEHDEHDDHDDHGHHGDQAEHDDDDHDDEAKPGEVRIAPSMLRDLRITTAKAESRTAGERVSALGELRVNQDAYAEVAAPVSARVIKVLARAGDTVTAKQPLVVLHSADVGRARAESSAAATRVELAKKTLDRKRALLADRLIPEREVLEAEAELSEAEADQQIAAATLRQVGGDALTVRSPIAGTVIERDVVIGQLADPERTLYRIGDLSMLWLVAHVFERDAVRVHVGGVGTASFAALPGRTVDGTITWIGREVDPASRTIPVRLDVPNADEVLRPGMSATVSLPLGDATGTVVAVPLAAVQRVGGSWVVFVPRGEGVFETRPIGRGRDLAGEIEVLSGLAPGDEVVVDGAFLLKAESDKARGEGGHDHAH